MTAEYRLDHLSDPDLLAQLKTLVARDARLTGVLLAHLAEVEERRLHLAAGFSSLFTYCCQELGFSEDVACRRIAAARVGRRFPVILERVAQGAIHLAGLSLLIPHLTEGNCVELLDAARGRSKRDVERLVAERFPMPDVPAVVRKLPAAPPRPPAPLVVAPETASAATSAPAPNSPAPSPVTAMALPATSTARIVPLAPARYKVQFTADQALHDDLCEAQALLRHALPDGDVGAVISRALRLLVADLRRRRCAATESPRSTEPTTGPQAASRTVPAAVRRAVWRRDGNQCTFVGPDGRRCSERGFLELHHLHAHALGGPPTVANLALRCKSHNQYEGERTFGAEHMARARQATTRQAELF
jgi:5-methylcytosine-specific restriction endonuclease McrA